MISQKLEIQTPKTWESMNWFNRIAFIKYSVGKILSIEIDGKFTLNMNDIIEIKRTGASRIEITYIKHGQQA